MIAVSFVRLGPPSLRVRYSLRPREAAGNSLSACKRYRDPIDLGRPVSCPLVFCARERLEPRARAWPWTWTCASKAVSRAVSRAVSDAVSKRPRPPRREGACSCMARSHGQVTPWRKSKFLFQTRQISLRQISIQAGKFSTNFPHLSHHQSTIRCLASGWQISPKFSPTPHQHSLRVNLAR